MLNEMPLGLSCGARAAAWADYNGDHKPDLLLATPFGPKLFANEGGKFEDVSAGLPHQGYYNLTAAAWLDYDDDGRPDILLADGFRGLRLYRNRASEPERPRAPSLGPWYYAGPFDNTGNKGFDTVYPPELGVDLATHYAGKGGEKVVWRKAQFRDGQVNDLRLFKPQGNENAAAYVYRELDFGGAAELPVSLGSDDSLTVWLNGTRVLAETRPAATRASDWPWSGGSRSARAAASSRSTSPPRSSRRPCPGSSRTSRAASAWARLASAASSRATTWPSPT